MPLHVNSMVVTASENDASSPNKGRSKRRVRTESQLARKREIDRQTQYQIRHKNKERMDLLESTVVELQENFNRVSEQMADMQILMRGMLEGNGSRSSSASIVRSQYPVILDSPADLSKILRVTHGIQDDIFDNNMASSLAHASLDTHAKYQYISLPTPSPSGSPLPSILNHPTSPSVTNYIEAAECFATCAFNILSRAHLDLLKDIRSKQRIPRDPTLANMLLVDTDSNPVVQAISCSFRHCSPLNVADTMATYFIMYRLLRVCYSLN
jgi:hypothetical protein